LIQKFLPLISFHPNRFDTLKRQIEFVIEEWGVEELERESMKVVEWTYDALVGDEKVRERVKLVEDNHD
jgi:hypothetical protein